MKKVILLAMFFIGILLLPLDVDNMMIFVLSKVVALLCVAPYCIIYGEY